MNIENITNPNQEPQNGDLLRYIYDSGTILEKRYYNIIEEEQEPTQEDIENEERQWRDAELKGTDWIVSVTDHPNHASYLVYREELRDYPQQADFPNGDRPTRP